MDNQETATTSPGPKHGRELAKVVLASCAGTAMEWYDFFMYGWVATLLFGRLFFPAMDATVSTLIILGTFSVGYFARPLGGLVSAHYGDCYGRKRVLMATMVLMGLSTTAIGLLPTYASIGVAAPVLLILLRFLQGVALGGESVGALLLLVESAPPDRRGFLGSVVMATGPFAQVVGSLVLLAVTTLPETDLLAWGWRIPFLLSFVLLVIGSFVRNRVEESPMFLAAQQRHQIVRLPLVEVLARHWRPTLAILLASLAETTIFNLSSVFALSFGTRGLHMALPVFVSAMLYGNICSMVLTPLLGMLADRVGKRPLFMAGILLGGLYAYPFFLMLQSGSTTLATLAVVLGIGVIHPVMFAPEGALFPELFDTKVRYTGVSIGKQFGTLGGGSVPLIATSLVLATGTTAAAVGYVVTVCAIGFTALLLVGARSSRAHAVALS